MFKCMYNIICIILHYGIRFLHDNKSSQGLRLYYSPQPLASADNTNCSHDDSLYQAQPHPIWFIQ